MLPGPFIAQKQLVLLRKVFSSPTTWLCPGSRYRDAYDDTPLWSAWFHNFPVGVFHLCVFKWFSIDRSSHSLFYKLISRMCSIWFSFCKMKRSILGSEKNWTEVSLLCVTSGYSVRVLGFNLELQNNFVSEKASESLPAGTLHWVCIRKPSFCCWLDSLLWCRNHLLMTLSHIRNFSTVNRTLKGTMAHCFSLISWPSSVFEKKKKKDWIGPSLLLVWQYQILRY